MKLDSSTTANITTLAAMNPSTALVVLVLGVGLIYLGLQGVSYYLSEMSITVF